jgi:hypothetical protein
MFKFIKTKDENNEFDISNISIELDDDVSLFDLTEEFKKFLIACGYGVDKNSRLVFLDDGETIF